MFIILCRLSQSHHGRCHHQHRHDAIIDVVFLHAVASSWMMFTSPAIVIQPRMKPNVLHSYITANPKPRALHLNRSPPIMDCAVGHAGLEKRHGQVGKDDLECVLGRLRPELRLYEDANTVLKPHTFDSGSYLASTKPQSRILQALGHGWEHADSNLQWESVNSSPLELLQGYAERWSTHFADVSLNSKPLLTLRRAPCPSMSIIFPFRVRLRIYAWAPLPSPSSPLKPWH